MTTNFIKMEYVTVAETEQDQESIELPVEDNGTILLSTVAGQFPGACGLKYRSESGSWRGLRFAEERLQFPGGQWTDITYIVVYPKDNKRKGEESAGNPVGKTRKLDMTKSQDLVVLGLPWKTTEVELKTYFEQFGEVVFSEIKYDRETGKSKGFGFIRFSDVEIGKQVASKKHLIQGRICEVKAPDSKQEKKKIFVGSLPKDLSEEELNKYFSEYGKVIDVYLPKPHRGFAFVTFEDGAVAQELKSMEHIIKGHQVQLKDADPKGKNRSQWEGKNDGPGFGGRGGGFSGRGDQGHQEDWSGRGYGRFQQDSQEQGTGNQLPMVLAAALKKALHGMQGQGDRGGQRASGNPGGATGGYEGGYGNMNWGQGGQSGQSSGKYYDGYYQW